MKQGDFTQLATAYRHRPGYSDLVLEALLRWTGARRNDFRVADVGAGTGKLTEMLAAAGLRGFAVEPNDAMREEGLRSLGDDTFAWSKGSGESTNLPDNSVDWVLMASSFHWTEARLALQEFQRILRPGGHFTALWNPRDIDRSPLEQSVEARIKERVPDLQRVSSGSKACTDHLHTTLLEDGRFTDLIFMEAPHEMTLSREGYLGVWRSVNDVQAQAGAQRFAGILEDIEKLIQGMDTVTIPYKTRAWTVRVLKG